MDVALETESESESPLLRLPPEVLRSVVARLRARPSDILSLARIGNALLLDLAREQLYKAVLIVPTSKRLIRTLSSNEELAFLVRDVTVVFSPTASTADLQLADVIDFLQHLSSITILRLHGLNAWLSSPANNRKTSESQFWNAISELDSIHTLHFHASLPFSSHRGPPYFHTLALCSELEISPRDPEWVFPPGTRRIFYDVTDTYLPSQIWFTLEDLVIYSGGDKTEPRVQAIIASLETYYAQHSGLNFFSPHLALRRLILDCEELSLPTLRKLLRRLKGHPLEVLHLLCVPDDHSPNADFELFHDIGDLFSSTLSSLIVFLGRGYEIVPWGAATHDFAKALQNAPNLTHIEINHSDGFTGPGHAKDAEIFAFAIPSLESISFGGKFPQCLSISWEIHRRDLITRNPDGTENEHTQIPCVIELSGQERRTPRPNAREWTHRYLDRRSSRSVTPTPAQASTPSAAY